MQSPPPANSIPPSARSGASWASILGTAGSPPAVPDGAETWRLKQEEIQALQQRSRGMMKMAQKLHSSESRDADSSLFTTSSIHDSLDMSTKTDSTGKTAVPHIFSDNESLKRQIADENQRRSRELASWHQALQCANNDHARLEAKIQQLEDQLAEESKALRSCAESEQRSVVEERRKQGAAHQKALKAVQEEAERLKKQRDDEEALASRLEKDLREARMRTSELRATRIKVHKASEHMQDTNAALRVEHQNALLQIKTTALDHEEELFALSRKHTSELAAARSIWKDEEREKEKITMDNFREVLQEYMEKYNMAEGAQEVAQQKVSSGKVELDRLWAQVHDDREQCKYEEQAVEQLREELTLEVQLAAQLQNLALENKECQQTMDDQLRHETDGCRAETQMAQLMQREHMEETTLRNEYQDLLRDLRCRLVDECADRARSEQHQEMLSSELRSLRRDLSSIKAIHEAEQSRGGSLAYEYDTAEDALAYAAREGVRQTAEISELKQTCAFEAQQNEAEKKRLMQRLRCQKEKLDKLTAMQQDSDFQLEQQNIEINEAEERCREQVHLLREERIQDKNASRASMKRLQQSCKDLENEQGTLQSEHTAKLHFIEMEAQDDLDKCESELITMEEEVHKLTDGRVEMEAKLATSMAELQVSSSQVLDAEEESKHVIGEVCDEVELLQHRNSELFIHQLRQEEQLEKLKHQDSTSNNELEQRLGMLQAESNHSERQAERLRLEFLEQRGDHRIEVERMRRQILDLEQQKTDALNALATHQAAAEDAAQEARRLADEACKAEEHAAATASTAKAPSPAWDSPVQALPSQGGLPPLLPSSPGRSRAAGAQSAYPCSPSASSTEQLVASSRGPTKLEPKVPPKQFNAYPPSPPPPPKCSAAAAAAAAMGMAYAGPADAPVRKAGPENPPAWPGSVSCENNHPDPGCRSPRNTAEVPLPSSTDDVERIVQHAEALCEAQEHEKSVPLFQQALSTLQARGIPTSDGLEAEVCAYLGVALQNLGRVEDAVQAYSRAVEKDPQLHVCHANLASLLAFLEDYARARQHLEVALRLDPWNPTYLELSAELGMTLSSAERR